MKMQYYNQNFKNDIAIALLFLLMLMNGLTNIQAQKNIPKIISKLQVELMFENDSIVNINDQIPNYSALESYLKKEQLAAFKKGFLAYAIDAIITPDSIQYCVNVYQGKQYKWGNINWDVENDILTKTGLNPDKLTGLAADPIHIYSFYERVIGYYENNGYPFAAIQLKNIQSNNDSISGELHLEAGQQFVYDTIAVHGDAGIKNNYLQHYLSIIQGEKFKEKDFKLISKKLKELPFAVETQKPSIEFIDKKALVHVYLKKKSANFFNGIIGILPNSPQLANVTGGSNVLITGDLKLTLINSLKNGEKMDVSWKSLQPGTQRLQTEFSFPYLFNTAFGIDDELDLLKQDTSFINFSNQLGLLYAISSNKNLKVFWENKSTTILNPKLNTQGDLLGNNSNSYGLEYSMQVLDYKYNPRKGYRFNVVFQGGNRTLDGGNAEDETVEINYPSDNDNISITALIPKSSAIYKAELNFEYYIPLYKIMTLKLATQNAYVHNNYLFNNDLSRLGGFHLLRGFDEQSLFTSLYSVLTIEYRLLLEQNSFIGVFFDQAYTQKNTFIDQGDDFPFGFGASINFQTKPGIFSLMYAVGRQQGNPISFTSAKIHFGFISLF